MLPAVSSSTKSSLRLTKCVYLDLSPMANLFHLNQWFWTGSCFPSSPFPHGTSDKVWRHFWLSQQTENASDGRDEGSCPAYHAHDNPSHRSIGTGCQQCWGWETLNWRAWLGTRVVFFFFLIPNLMLIPLQVSKDDSVVELSLILSFSRPMCLWHGGSCSWCCFDCCQPIPRWYLARTLLPSRLCQ